MAYWPNDGGRFNVMHLTDGSSMQVMGESSEADLSAFSLTNIHKVRDFPTQAQEQDLRQCSQATTGHRFY